ncbi:MAG: hypothetical protein IJU12_05360 [Clostridia bacterium]|nr:hypothetical protein [Clostridia bacterium]
MLGIDKVDAPEENEKSFSSDCKFSCALNSARPENLIGMKNSSAGQAPLQNFSPRRRTRRRLRIINNRFADRLARFPSKARFSFPYSAYFIAFCPFFDIIKSHIS